MRGGEAGLLFRGVLEAVQRLYDGRRHLLGVENLQVLPSTIEGDRQMLAWLRGERQWYDEAEQRHRQGAIPVTRMPTVTITEESTYTCNNCSRTFPSNQSLRAHVESRECV